MQILSRLVSSRLFGRGAVRLLVVGLLLLLGVLLDQVHIIVYEVYHAIGAVNRIP